MLSCVKKYLRDSPVGLLIDLRLRSATLQSFFLFSRFLDATFQFVNIKLAA